MGTVSKFEKPFGKSFTFLVDMFIPGKCCETKDVRYASKFKGDKVAFRITALLVPKQLSAFEKYPRNREAGTYFLVSMLNAVKIILQS